MRYIHKMKCSSFMLNCWLFVCLTLIQKYCLFIYSANNNFQRSWMQVSSESRNVEERASRELCRNFVLKIFSIQKSQKMQSFIIIIEKRMLLKSFVFSSTNLKSKIKSLPKDTFKVNNFQTTSENDKMKRFSSTQKQKIFTNKNVAINERRGLAGLKPLNWKRQSKINKQNGLVILPLTSTKDKLSSKKKNSFLKLNFGENSKKTSIKTENKDTLRQLKNNEATSLLQLKECVNLSGRSEVGEENAIEKLLQMSNSIVYSENEIKEIDERDEITYFQLPPVNQQSKTKKVQHIKSIIERNYKIQSKTVDLQFLIEIGPQLTNRCDQLKNEVAMLEQKYTKLKYRIGQLDEANQQTNSQFITKARFLAEFQEKYRNVLALTKAQEQKLLIIKKELESKNLQLQLAIQKGKQIQSYVVTQQKRKLLHEVSEDYKKKEGDMYDYALQMQTNTWATGFKEVKPFTEQEKYLENRMNALQRELSNDQSVIPFEKKCNQVKDFVIKMYSSFKRMNDDMRSVNDFKTKCIRQFVLRMQKWLQNWQLKQQFLVNLRQDFALQQTKINQSLVQLQKVMQSKGIKIMQQPKYIEIKTSLQKIKQNYKLGNSFY